MIKKSVSLCLSLVLVLSLCFCLPLNASASSTVGSQSCLTNYFYATENKNIVVYQNNSPYTNTVVYPAHTAKTFKITNLKSNKGGVWLRNFGTYFTINSQSFTGTAKITYKFNGKSQTLKYTVKKYTNPCKSFKIGSTEYAKTFNSKTSTYSFRNVKNQKLQIQANSGWVITEIVTSSSRYNGKSDMKFYKPNKSSFTKNNLTLFNNGYSYLYVTFKNTSNGGENTLLYLVR